MQLVVIHRGAIVVGGRIGTTGYFDFVAHAVAAVSFRHSPSDPRSSPACPPGIRRTRLPEWPRRRSCELLHAARQETKSQLPSSTLAPASYCRPRRPYSRGIHRTHRPRWHRHRSSPRPHPYIRRTTKPSSTLAVAEKLSAVTSVQPAIWQNRPVGGSYCVQGHGLVQPGTSSSSRTPSPSTSFRQAPSQST